MIELNTPAHEHTITADYYELSTGHNGDDSDEITHVGLHVIEGDTRTTLAMTVHDAETIGKLLVSHTDYAAGRPPRDW